MVSKATTGLVHDHFKRTSQVKWLKNVLISCYFFLFGWIPSFFFLICTLSIQEMFQLFSLIKDYKLSRNETDEEQSLMTVI